jgi:hypothetical protein
MPVIRLELFDIAGENSRQVLGEKVCSFGIDYILLLTGTVKSYSCLSMQFRHCPDLLQ